MCRRNETAEIIPVVRSYWYGTLLPLLHRTHVPTECAATILWIFTNVGIGSFCFLRRPSVYRSLNNLSLGVGLGDGHGLQVLPLGDLGLELCDDGGDVRDVL